MVKTRTLRWADWQPGQNPRNVDISVLKISTIRVERTQLYEYTDMEQGKVVPFHAIKTYRESRGIAPLILYIIARRVLLVNYTPLSYYPGKRTPVTIEHEAEKTPEQVLTISRRSKSLSPARSRTPVRPARRQVPIPLLLWMFVKKASADVSNLVNKIVGSQGGKSYKESGQPLLVERKLFQIGLGVGVIRV